MQDELTAAGQTVCMDSFSARAAQVFDVTRKVTYQNLATWYQELREYCETIPCFLVANKIDVDMAVCGHVVAVQSL